MNKTDKHNLDQLVVHLIKATKNSAAEELPHSPSPFFISKIRARIAEQEKMQSFLHGLGFSSLRNWLVGLGGIAMMIFASSIWLADSPLSVAALPAPANTTEVVEDNAVLDNSIEDIVIVAEERK